MLTADAVIHGDRARLLGFSEIEHPLALQIGGSDPEKIRKAAAIGAALGYDEINLNIGCPSDRVQAGRFGACLMREPDLVARLWSAAQQGAGAAPVTIKCRIGVDEQDPKEALFVLVELAAREGCATFIVHARKALLAGLSPKENRSVPPLDYALVRDLKSVRPKLEIILNGGLGDLDHAISESAGLDGVMLGRAAYQNPALLLEADERLFARAPPNASRVAAVHAFLPYIEARLREGVRLHAMTRHMLGLFAAQPGGRSWRRVLSQQGVRSGAGAEVVRMALSEVEMTAAEAA
jgi:tRNA-dihydrouridine synthase A